MTRLVSWSHRRSGLGEKWFHLWKLTLFGLGVAVTVIGRQASIIVGTGRVNAHFTVGLPLERPNAFRRVNEVDMWRRVGFLCFAVSLFVQRKDVTP